MYATAVALWFGLAIGNFLWQTISWKKDWGKAAEASFYQAIALGAFLLLMANQ